MSEKVTKVAIDETTCKIVTRLMWTTMQLLLIENQSDCKRYGLVTTMYKFSPITIRRLCETYTDDDICSMVVKELRGDGKAISPLLESIVNDRVRNCMEAARLDCWSLKEVSHL